MNVLKRSFPPVVGQAPRVSILGTLPGERSLQAGELRPHYRRNEGELGTTYRAFVTTDYGIICYPNC